MKATKAWYFVPNSVGNGFTIREGDSEDWLVIGTIPMTNDPEVAKGRAALIVESVNASRQVEIRALPKRKERKK